MSPSTRLAAAGLLLALLTVPLALGEEAPRGKVIKAGKSASAFVTGKRLRAQGSAFCINAAGLFVTNEHVIRDETEVTLVIDSGLKTARKVTAKVLRASAELDLALLKVDDPKGLTALPLADKDDVSETDELIAFGFPFGARLSADGKESPAITVSVGKVTSLREKDDALHRIQLDAVLNKGNSGGAVLNKEGKVAGVVVGGIAVGGAAAGINFAIPVSHVHRFLSRAELVFDPAPLKFGAIHAATEFKAISLDMLPGAKPVEMELTLHGEGLDTRRFKMKADEGAHSASAVPYVKAKAGAPLRLTATFARGSVKGEITDREIKVGKAAFKLSEVRRLLGGPAGRAWLHDGRFLKGEVASAEAEVLFGAVKAPFDLAKADEVRFHAPALTALSATVVARRDGKEIGRVTRAIEVEGAPKEDEGETFLDIEPPALEADTITRKLESPVADLAVGGGGRYLILHMPKARKLAVFDVNEAKVVKTLPADDEKLLIAAGLEKLLVVLPGSRTIERWDLRTFKRETSIKYPIKGDVLAVAMGSASQGPAALLAKDGVSPFVQVPVFLGLDDLKPREVAWSSAGHVHPLHGDKLHLRAAPDGRSFAAWTMNSIPSGAHWFHVEKTTGKRQYSHTSHGHVVPGRGGKALFTGSGLFTELAFPKGNKTLPGTEPQGRYLPAQHSDFYLYLGDGTPFRGDAPARTLDVRRLGSDKAVMSIKGVEVPATKPEGGTDVAEKGLAFDKRFHLIPDAKVFVFIPPGDDRLVVKNVDPSSPTEPEKK